MIVNLFRGFVRELLSNIESSTMADNGSNLELRLGSPGPQANHGLDLELRLGLPPRPDVAPAPPVQALAPPERGRQSRLSPEFVITWLLNPYLMGLYHQVPANLRNAVVVLDSPSFFALNHNEMQDEFFFCNDNIPRPLQPWVRSEGRRVFTNGNLIGRFATYSLSGVRFTRYSSNLQQVWKFLLFFFNV